MHVELFTELFQGEPGDIPNYITEFSSLRGPPGPPVSNLYTLPMILLSIVNSHFHFIKHIYYQM